MRCQPASICSTAACSEALLPPKQHAWCRVGGSAVTHWNAWGTRRRAGRDVQFCLWWVQVMQGAGPDVSVTGSLGCLQRSKQGERAGERARSSPPLLLVQGCAAGSRHCPLHLAPLPVHRTASSKHRCCFVPAAAKWCSPSSARLRRFVIPERSPQHYRLSPGVSK